MVNDPASPFDGIVPFVRVADALSFRAAARDLGVTPAAVSRAVQRLEERLGVRLFERTTRTVRLTPEGERFALRCREALAQVRLGQDELGRTRAAPHGTLAISASPILAPLVVPRLSRFLARHPGLRADLRLTDRVVRFAEEDVDLALRVGPAADDDVVARPVLETRWVTIASPTYLARRGEPRGVEDLARHDTLRFAPPRGRARPWTFARATPALEPLLVVDRGDLLVDAALSDLGVAQVLDFMVSDLVRDGRLVEVLREHAVAGPTVHAVYPQSRRALPRVRAFVAFLEAELRAAGPPRDQ